MFNILEKYIQNITQNDINNFASSKNIKLNNEELDFTYKFIKKNYKDILNNPKLFNIDQYENRYSKENFPKVKKLFIEYFSKYRKFFQNKKAL